VLTHSEDFGCSESLDYIFECYFNEVMGSDKALQLESDSLRVEKFLIYHCGDKGKMYTQLSDHYGLSCEITYKGTLFINRRVFKGIKCY
jgi:hypothetical protein